MGKSLFGSVFGAVVGAAGAVGNTAVSAGSAVTGAVVGTAVTTGTAVTGAAVGVGGAITNTANSSGIEEVSTWEKALEAVIDSVIGSDFNQIELQDFINKLTLEKPHITPEEICNKIIDKKSLQSGLFGAVTGVGGLALLPVAIPTNLYTSWKIQAATVMAIAHVYGYQPSKTDTCLVLFGAADSKMQAFKTMGIEAAKVATKKAVDLYMTREILKSVFRLSLREAATKMAQKALITKMIPLIGAPIGFGFDWFTTQAVGKVAIKYYGGK